MADAAVFTDPRLFACPRRYWFVEDVWLCYVAGWLNGYGLFRSPAQFEMAEDEHALFRTLGRTRRKLQRHLIRQGWEPRCGPVAPRPAGQISVSP